MNEVTGFVDLTQSSVVARQNTQNALMKSVANEFANSSKELFVNKVLSKITSETDMTAALIYCAKATGNYGSVLNAMQTEPLGSLITGISQRIVKVLSIKDRTLPQEVSSRS